MYVRMEETDAERRLIKCLNGQKNYQIKQEVYIKNYQKNLIKWGK